MNSSSSPLAERKTWWSLAAAALFTAMLLPLRPANTFAHGIVGDRIFLSPVVGNDAFPDNALTLVSRRSDYEFSLIPSFEKQLSDNSSLLFVSGWERITPGRRQRGTAGSADLSIYFRQGAYISVAHELELTLSPILVLPIGTKQIADQGYTHLGGEVLLGKGFGDLLNSPTLESLRPFAVQAEAGYAGRIQGPANSDVFGNLEVEYSLGYLDHFVERLNIDRPWTDFVPYVQFNFAQSFIASRLTTKPDFRLTPGLAYMGHSCELSVGTQIEINNAAPSGDRVAVVGLVEIFYDDISPALGWKPF